jgi:hypothetical protein
MYRIIQYCLLLLCASLLLTAQNATRQKPAPSTADQRTDVDPLALKVLKAVTDPIREAQTYSFRTRVIREELGTNGQIITYFTTSEITVARPDKLRVNFTGRGHEVQLFYDGGQAVLYEPESKLYATIQAPKTLDGVLDALEKRDVYLPVRNLLESDPYRSLAPDLKTGYVIGKVQLFGTTVHQLAFTEQNAEWQLWVTGGATPRIQGLQVVNLARPHQPRIMVEFEDWNLNAPVESSMFSFQKPVDAKEINFLQLRSKK